MASEAPDLIAKARAFQPQLKARAAEIEAGRQLPDDIARGFADAGFYRLCVPREAGGLEIDPLTLSQVIETIAYGDASAGWCVMIGSTTGLCAAYVPTADAAAIFGQPHSIVAGVFAPRGRADDMGDHYMVRGRWQWGSGSPNAQYIMGGAVIHRDGQPVLMENGAPVSRMMIARKEDVTLHDNWQVAGLSGTGSQDFSFDNLRIEKKMSVGLITDRPLKRPLYAFPVFGLLAAGVASVMLGIGRRAIDELVHLAREKTPEGHRRPLAQRSRTQEDVAAAEASLGAARAYLHQAIGEAYGAARRDGKIGMDDRARLRMAASHAARVAINVTDAMHLLAGGSAVYASSPFQRLLRDVHVASQHMMVGTPTFELAGRVILGVEADLSQL
ncbi:MAG TPA: acyl-CoA dehydrogenase family protein [Micropepsaceae bacterium]|nr:acyl-CoA dehydrogenase family protein [Micropepsaceae bacterium]